LFPFGRAIVRARERGGLGRREAKANEEERAEEKRGVGIVSV
jgi:hypothetical protein